MELRLMLLEEHYSFNRFRNQKVNGDSINEVVAAD